MKQFVKIVLNYKTVKSDMLKKISIAISSLLVFGILTSFTITPPLQKPVRTIIIDAGHGIMANGGYNGAKGSYSYEDQICLAISKKVVDLMHTELPDVKIVETRPTEKITGLHERADIANQNKGDLFISIHVNAMPEIRHKKLIGYERETVYVKKGKKKKKVIKKVPQYRYYTTVDPAKGTQTYIWGAHKAEDKEVAIRENAPMFSEENYQEKYGNIDPNSPEFVALSLLKTKQFQTKSITLADFIEEEFAKAGRVSQGAYQRQKGIWVLQATAMPSVLVETGFITNKSEEDYLNSESGQQETARAIVNAVKKYISWLEKKGSKPQANHTDKQPSASTANYSFLEGIDKREHASQSN
jgi:N-acetylmuramoyl-L-alanine amidase